MGSDGQQTVGSKIIFQPVPAPWFELHAQAALKNLLFSDIFVRLTLYFFSYIVPAAAPVTLKYFNRIRTSDRTFLIFEPQPHYQQRFCIF